VNRQCVLNYFFFFVRESFNIPPCTNRRTKKKNTLTIKELIGILIGAIWSISRIFSHAAINLDQSCDRRAPLTKQNANSPDSRPDKKQQTSGGASLALLLLNKRLSVYFLICQSFLCTNVLTSYLPVYFAAYNT
jgi:hypothetical protein